jgi:hypothetical protein
MKKSCAEAVTPSPSSLLLFPMASYVYVDGDAVNTNLVGICALVTLLRLM